MKDVQRYSTRVGAMLLVCALIGCGDDGDEQLQPDVGVQPDAEIQSDTGNQPDSEDKPDASEDTAPDVASDTVAPEYRDVRVSIGGEFASEIDLRDEDEVQILPTTATAAFKLFMRDETSASEDLVVEIVDADGDTITPTDGPTFRNGLWNVEVEIGPGVSARPKVSDAAGNEAVYDAALVIPSHREAIIDEWRTLLYDADFKVEEHWLSEFDVDGNWEQSQGVDGGWRRGGSFTFDEDNLVVTETFSAEDSDESTAEWKEVGEYYVDETYLARQPLGRDGIGDGLVGAWSYEYERFEHSGTALESQGTYTMTVRFDGDGTWEETLDTGTGVDQTRSGTWTVETNDGYAANFGDFLVRTTTHEDETPLQTSIESTELFVIRLDNLLISPRIRGHGQ